MNQQISDPKTALRTMRFLWFGLLSGPLSFLFVIVMIVSGSDQEPAEIGMLLGYVAIGMLIVLTPIGYFIRGQIYKASWQGDVVTPKGYYVGNLILLSTLEGVALFGLVATMVHGALGLPLVPAVLAMAIQVINFPNGRAMHPPDRLMDG